MIIILTSVNTTKLAKKISKGLVHKKLAFCVKIINNVSSTYYWKDKIISDKEIIILIKSFKQNLKDVKKFILENHNYDTPEIITLDTESLNENYTKWAQKLLK